jgi:hypothetical protein
MTYQPWPVQALWRLRVPDGWAHAEVWTHLIGWELRVLWDGELQRSQEYRDLAGLAGNEGSPGSYNPERGIGQVEASCGRPPLGR